MSYREDTDWREPDWMTLGQAARLLGVAQSTMRKWSDHGRIPTFYTPGGHRRYRRGDLETFLVRSTSARRTGEGDSPGLSPAAGEPEKPSSD